MTAWIALLPGPLRLALALLLVLLLPAGFVGLCILALRQAGAARFASSLNLFTIGLTFLLLVLLALRHSPTVLAWCLGAAAVLVLVPLALNHAVRRGGASPPLPLPIQVASVLFVPVFFLWLNFVEETLHISLPRIYILPPR